MDSFLVQVRNIFSPPAESDLAHMVFEQISQRIDEPITLYYLRKTEAFYPTVQESCTETFTYFKDHVIRGINCPSYQAESD